jgi:adenine-specific DNA-methyltransferase
VELPDREEITLTQLEKREGKSKRYYRDDPERVFHDFPGARIFKSENITSGGFRKNQSLIFHFKGKPYNPGLSRGNC